MELASFDFFWVTFRCVFHFKNTFLPELSIVIEIKFCINSNNTIIVRFSQWVDFNFGFGINGCIVVVVVVVVSKNSDENLV